MGVSPALFAMEIAQSHIYTLIAHEAINDLYVVSWSRITSLHHVISWAPARFSFLFCYLIMELLLSHRLICGRYHVVFSNLHHLAKLLIVFIFLRKVI